MVGFLTNLFIGNLNAGSKQSINIRWSEFDKAIQSGSEIMDIDEAVGKEDLIHDNPNDPSLFAEVDALLKKHGISFEWYRIMKTTRKLVIAERQCSANDLLPNAELATDVLKIGSLFNSIFYHLSEDWAFIGVESR